jgi:hypothetical protein
MEGDLKYGEREGKIKDTYRRRENNKGHKQKCHQNRIKQLRHTSEEHRGAPPTNGQQMLQLQTTESVSYNNPEFKRWNIL